MLQTRVLRRRGKPVEIKESTDVVAVNVGPAPGRSRPAATGERPRAKKASRRPAPGALDTMASGLPEEDARALERAGWIFVRPEDASGYGQQARVAKVFVTPGGHIALGTDRLTIKLKDAVDPERAREILARYGLRVLQALRFAPGLYQVQVGAPEAGKDTLDVADDLVRAGVAEFAEPEFVEAIGGR